jgi:5-hydroxyisourate hydrolase-like protein (transthyretin family)
VRFTVSERARVSIRIQRRSRSRWSEVNSFTRTRAAGRGSMSFSAHALRAGRYRVVTRAEDGARNRSRRVVRRLRAAPPSRLPTT